MKRSLNKTPSILVNQPSELKKQKSKEENFKIIFDNIQKSYQKCENEPYITKRIKYLINELLENIQKTKKDPIYDSYKKEFDEIEDRTFFSMSIRKLDSEINYEKIESDIINAVVDDVWDNFKRRDIKENISFFCRKVNERYKIFGQ